MILLSTFFYIVLAHINNLARCEPIKIFIPLSNKGTLFHPPPYPMSITLHHFFFQWKDFKTIRLTTGPFRRFRFVPRQTFTHANNLILQRQFTCAHIRIVFVCALRSIFQFSRGKSSRSRRISALLATVRISILEIPPGFVRPFFPLFPRLELLAFDHWISCCSQRFFFCVFFQPTNPLWGQCLS